MYYHKNDRDEFVSYLAEKFPKCFFEEPTQRLPLKRDILLDLEQQRILDHDKLEQTLDWYCNHFAYHHALVAGAPRVNLDGDKAGTVTATEQRQATTYVKERKAKMAERQETIRPPVAPALTPIKQIHARAAVAEIKPAPGLHPMLAAMQAAIAIANTLLTEKAYEPMRQELATTAIRKIVNHANSLLDELTADNQER